MATRSKRKSQPETVVSNGQVGQARVENSWIMLTKDELLENSSFSVITLPHPSNGQPSKYCLDEQNKKMYEIITFTEPYRSWFIGETVKSDGSILLATPVNPLFLILPRLREQCVKNAVPLEDLLSEKGFEKILDFITTMEDIGDMKGPPDMKAYKYNEEKTLSWLESRVRKLAKVLREKNVHVTSGAVSATFVASSVNNDNIDEEFYLKYAHGIISEYLQDDLMETLSKRFNFSPELIESVGKKRKSEGGNMNEVNKKIKSEDSNIKMENGADLSSSFTETKKPKAVSAKEKARIKAASGTKTISSFFVKK